jgi:hypothetical protein
MPGGTEMEKICGRPGHPRTGISRHWTGRFHRISAVEDREKAGVPLFGNLGNRRQSHQPRETQPLAGALDAELE